MVVIWPAFDPKPQTAYGIDFGLDAFFHPGAVGLGPTQTIYCPNVGPLVCIGIHKFIQFNLREDQFCLVKLARIYIIQNICIKDVEQGSFHYWIDYVHEMKLNISRIINSTILLTLTRMKFGQIPTSKCRIYSQEYAWKACDKSVLNALKILIRINK